MADKARQWTDEELEEMEKYLHDIYEQAGKDLVKKANKYLEDFVRKDNAKQEKIKSGELTEEEYKEWRKNQLLYFQHWPRLIKDVQNEMANCNQTALEYINGRTPDIFAVNYNSIAEVIDNSPVGGYSFELINPDTVRQIATSDGVMLPPPEKELDVDKDKQWNAKQVNAQLLQGILQGESIPKIAARMAKVCDSNKAAATRNARTMVTAAENSGRQSGINRATKDGIILIKEWLATNDSRTRDSHAAINHERIRCDASTEKEKTFSNGLAFPADWRGRPEEVYNCRCTLITKFAGVDRKRLNEAVKEKAKSKASNGDTFGSPTNNSGKSTSRNKSKVKQKASGIKVEKPLNTNEVYNELIKLAKHKKLMYNQLQYHANTLSEDEIINLLGGKDKTKGSCASLSLAYIGQKLGINVLDFKGGESLDLFSQGSTLRLVAKLDGVVSYTDREIDKLQRTKNLIKNCENGKEYMICCGSHASIIRKTNKGVLQYLELQKEEKNNGWKRIRKSTFINRFKLDSKNQDGDKSSKYVMINITDSNFGDDFKYILGYINTAEYE